MHACSAQAVQYGRDDKSSGVSCVMQLCELISYVWWVYKMCKRKAEGSFYHQHQSPH